MPLLEQWGREGNEMGCVGCDSRFIVKKIDDAIRVIHIQKQAPVAEAPVLEPDTPDTIDAVEEITEADTEVETEPAVEMTKILFVDDDRLATALAKSELSGTDIDITVVRSGEAALEELEKNEYSLLVTDLHLKDSDDPTAQLDGDELLREVIAMEKNIPFIVTTGKEIVDDMVLDPKWVDLEVKGFVQKGNPFWTEELKTRIKEVLNMH